MKMLEITERSTARKFDIDDSQLVAITLQALDFIAPAKLYAGRSTSFRLADTANNAEILEFANVIGSSGTKKYQAIEVLALQNGFAVFEDAFLIVLSYEKGQGYEAVLFDNTLDFFERLGDKSVAELSGLDVEVPYTTTEIDNSTEYDWEDIVTYPLMDYGYAARSNSIYLLGSIYPSYFGRFLFERIISEAGFTYTGLTSSNLAGLNTLLLPFTNDKFEPFDTEQETFAEDFSARAGLTSDVTFNFPTANTFRKLELNNVTTAGFYNSDNSNINASQNEYQINENAELTINASVAIRWNRSSGDGFQRAIFVQIVLETSAGGILVLAERLQFITAGKEVITFPQVVATTSVETNPKKIYLRGRLSSDNSESVSFTTIADQDYFLQVDAKFLQPNNRNINLADNAPNLKQIDFFKDVCVLLRKNVQVRGQQVQFFDLDEVLEATPVDWTDKQQADSQSVRYVPGGLGRISEIVWNGANDNQERDLVRIDDKIALAFQQAYLPDTVQLHRLIARQAYQTLDILSGQLVYVGNNTLEVSESGVFVFSKRRINGVLYLRNGTSRRELVVTAFPNFITNARIVNFKIAELLNLQDIAAKYEYYAEILNNYQEVNATLLLNAIDVLNFDARRPVRLGEQLYFVQKINQFIDNTRPVSVQLIRL